jgi:hypothetical protein
MAADHLNNVERTLIDKLRTGTYDGGTAWSSSDITVFGQFPEPEDVKYPCIVVEMVANGIDEQFIGMNVDGTTGELYGIGFRLHLAVQRDSSITVGSTPYKQRRLLNYLMLQTANVLMDCDFSSSGTEIDQRSFGGFTEIGYNSSLEVWAASTTMLLIFKNTR